MRTPTSFRGRLRDSYLRWSYRHPLVARYFLWRAKRPALTLVEANGYRLYVDATDLGTLSRRLIGSGSYEGSFVSFYRRIVTPGMTIFDIGANIGYFTVLFSRLAGPDGLIVAFEPAPSNFDLLSRNVEVNGCENVRLIRAAVSDRAASASLYLDRCHDGVHSMHASNVISRGRHIDVETVDLDSVVASLHSRPVHLIKMDTQGAEGLILRGATALLGQTSLVLVIEIWPHGLRSLGFEPRGLFDTLAGHGFQPGMLSRKGRWTPASYSDLADQADALASSRWSSFNAVFHKGTL